MSVGAIIAIVIVIVLIAVVVALARTQAVRSPALRRQFGPEYQNLVREVGPRRARADLIDRQRRVADLDIRPLTAEQHARYSGEWTATQEQFLDNPAQSMEAAMALLTSVAADRGYEVDDHAQLLKDLSVYHARQIDGYRRATRVAEQAATTPTEELRQAVLGCRELFWDLLGTQGRAAAESLAPDSATVTAVGSGSGRTRADRLSDE